MFTDSNWVSISAASLLVTYRTEQALVFHHFPGSLWRGVLGPALRDVCCPWRHGACRGCSAFSECLYAMFFEVSAATVGAQTPPRPFVLHLSWSDGCGAWAPGEVLGFGLTLFSLPVWNRLPQLIAALIRLGERGIGRQRVRLALESIDLVTADGEAQQRIFDQNRLDYPPQPSPWVRMPDFPTAPAPSIAINLLSPFIAERHGRHLSAGLPFQELVRAALRRRHLLQQAYGNNRAQDLEASLRRQAGELLELAEDVRILEDNTRWQSHQRYSGRQKQTQSQSGLLGWAAYGNVPPELCELLLLGVWTHLGKQTSMGMGAYSLSTANRLWQPPLWHR